MSIAKYVRRAYPFEVPALLRIGAHSSSGHTEELHARTLSKTLVACAGELAVGYAKWGAIWPDRNRAPFLQSVNVDRQYGEQGFDRLLVDAMSWVAIAGDADHDPGWSLITSASAADIQSHDFYEQAGFNRIGLVNLPDQDDPAFFYARNLLQKPPQLEALPLGMVPPVDVLQRLGFDPIQRNSGSPAKVWGPQGLAG